MTDESVTEWSVAEWSVTKAWAWRSCPRRFYVRYVLGLPPSQPASDSRVFGRMVHAGLQAAYEAARDQPGGGPAMSAYYDLAYAAIMDYGRGVGGEGGTIGRTARLDAAGVLEALLPWLRVPYPSSILAVERGFVVDIDGVRVRGVIDLALQTGPRSVHIRDWKSGALPEADQLPLNPQLGTYRLVAPLLWSWADEFDAGLYGVRAREERSISIGDDVARYVGARLLWHYYDSVDAAEARAAGAGLDQTYPTHPGSQCVTCDYASYCPLRAHLSLPVRDENEVAQGKQLLAHG